MKIDFVIAWVDGNDKNWQKEKEKYDNQPKTTANSIERYRDWDQLKYWFRGVEKYASWVNKIYFVTCGQRPKWLNEKHPKLVFVDHKDYIPKEYLPTFSANPIELNFHRIKGLSEHFVYFNDDVFIINPVKETDFFKHGLPCDDYGEVPLIMYGNDDTFSHMLVNDSNFANKYYNKRAIYKKSLFKYINIKYGLRNIIRTIGMMKYRYFSGFNVSHFSASFLKEAYKDVWKKENKLLSKISANKFRTKEDVNQYIFRYWQYFENKFYPRRKNFGINFGVFDENQELIDTIKNGKYKEICITDNENIMNFDKTKSEINEAFEEKFPEKSSFEK